MPGRKTLSIKLAEQVKRLDEAHAKVTEIKPATVPKTLASISNDLKAIISFVVQLEQGNHIKRLKRPDGEKKVSDWNKFIADNWHEVKNQYPNADKKQYFKILSDWFNNGKKGVSSKKSGKREKTSDESDELAMFKKVREVKLHPRRRKSSSGSESSGSEVNQKPVKGKGKAKARGKGQPQNGGFYEYEFF